MATTPLEKAVRLAARKNPPHEEIVALLRPVIDHPESVTSEQFLDAAIPFIESANASGAAIDRSPFVSDVERALENLSSLVMAARLRVRMMWSIRVRGWREDAIRLALHAANELPLIEPLETRALAVVAIGEVLLAAGLASEMQRMTELAWNERDHVEDAHIRFRLVEQYVRQQFMLAPEAVTDELLDELRATAGRTGNPMTVVKATASIGSGLVLLDRIPEALAAAQEAVAHLPPSAPADERALVMIQSAMVLRTAGRSAEASRLFDEAARLAENDPNLQLRSLAHARRAEELAADGNDAECWEVSRRAAAQLFMALAENPVLDGIASDSTTYGSIFRVGIDSAERLLPSVDPTRQQEIAKELLQLLDSVKCVATQEGLRRHPVAPPAAVGAESWRAHATLPDWARESSEGREVVRGVRRHPKRLGRSKRPLYLPPVVEHLTAAYPDLDTLTFEAPTLLLHFFFSKEDLIILPSIARDGAHSVLLTDAGTPFRVTETRESLDLIIDQHKATVDLVIRDVEGRGASDAPRLEEHISRNLRSIYFRAFVTIEGHKLVPWLRERLGDLRQWHLVLLLDGRLYEFPLHAAPLESGSRAKSVRFGELFASVTYAPAARVLALQHERARERRTEGVRGVLMATPLPDLPGVAREVAALEEAMPGRWWTHGDSTGDERPTYRNFLRRHRSGNLLWFCGHGGAAGDENGEAGFAFVDEPLNVRKLLSDPFDFSACELIVLTACWMGAMEFDESHEVTAFNTVLTMRGARRITSALWAVDDRMAVVFAAAYARALRGRCFGASAREPFAFARALGDAVAAIRTAEGGRFDHEFFWAPWVLYGIG